MSLLSLALILLLLILAAVSVDVWMTRRGIDSRESWLK